MSTELKEIIEKAWEDRELLKRSDTQEAVRSVIEELDKGRLRIARPDNGSWKVEEWLKKAVILYFPIQKID